MGMGGKTMDQPSIRQAYPIPDPTRDPSLPPSQR